ncbi:uncharacterized protein LOC114602194 isoform X2 [Podarcis muralis]
MKKEMVKRRTAGGGQIKRNSKPAGGKNPRQSSVHFPLRAQVTFGTTLPKRLSSSKPRLSLSLPPLIGVGLWRSAGRVVPIGGKSLPLGVATETRVKPGRRRYGPSGQLQPRALLGFFPGACKGGIRSGKQSCLKKLSTPVSASEAEGHPGS